MPMVLKSRHPEREKKRTLFFEGLFDLFEKMLTFFFLHWGMLKLKDILK